MSVESLSIISFPKAKEPITPAQYYRLIYPFIPKNPGRDNEVYFSTPIATGGAIRDFEHLSHDELRKKSSLIIRRNREFVEAIVAASTQDLQNMQVTIPNRLPQFRGFGASGFNRVWQGWFLGPEPDEFEAVQVKIEKDRLVDFSLMDSTIRQPQKSREEHLRCQDVYLDLVDKMGIKTNPLKEVVFVPDGNKSFGQQMELRISKKIGANTHFLKFDKNNPVFQEKILPIAPWLDKIKVQDFYIDNGGIKPVILFNCIKSSVAA